MGYDILEAKDTRWYGMNIWPLLSEEKNPPLINRELYWQGVQHKSAALLQGNWKLVVHRNNKKGRDGRMTFLSFLY